MIQRDLVAALDIDGPCLVETKTRQSRKAWIKKFGPVPDGMHVLHKCDNKLCRNTDHLYLGTPRRNTTDMAERGRGWWQHRSPNPVHREIAQRFANGEGRQELAIAFNVCPESISRIVRKEGRRAQS